MRLHYLAPTRDADPAWSPGTELLDNQTTMKLESPLVTAVKLALFITVHTPSSLACVKSCSAVLRGSLVSIVGNSPDVDSRLMAPFHAVLAKSRTTMVAQRKLAWVCQSMGKFERCLGPCPESEAKRMRMNTIHQWQSICDIANQYPKNFGDFIGCERRHHGHVLQHCPPFQPSPATGIDQFCRLLSQHSECYGQVPFKCKSENATMVWRLVNGVVQRAYEQAVAISANSIKLPSECHASMKHLVNSAWSTAPATERQTTRRPPTTTTTTTTTTYTTLATTTSTTISTTSSTTISTTTSTTTTTSTRTRPTTTATTTKDFEEFTMEYWQDLDRGHLYQYHASRVPSSSTTTTTLSPFTQTVAHPLPQGMNKSGGHSPFISNLYWCWTALLFII